MAHEIATMVDGRSAMAYVGETPWHGLGQALTKGAPLETWARESGMDFTIAGSPVLYQTAKALEQQGSKQVLYREDTGIALGVVGNKYKVVQPMEVLEFFRDLVEGQGFELETAGVLFGGAKYWALARTGNEVKIGEKDVLKDYLMLATACDGTLKTTARRTSIRVVCNNTLNLSSQNALNDIKVAHSTTFDGNAVKSELGLTPEAWDVFGEQARQLAETKLTDKQAIAFVRNLFKDSSEKGNTQVSKVLQLYSGQGKGSAYDSAQGTAWGLLNATTEMLDWHMGKSQDRRLEASWLYGGVNLKQQAFNGLLAVANDPGILIAA